MNTKEIDGHRKTLLSTTQDLQLKLRSSNNSLSSTYWQRDASYLRLKNVELSYNLPTKVVRSIGLEELRIFLNGQNLLTFDKLDVIDPEAYGNGVAYPLQLSFSAGINIKF